MFSLVFPGNSTKVLNALSVPLIERKCSCSKMQQWVQQRTTAQIRTDSGCDEAYTAQMLSVAQPCPDSWQTPEFTCRAATVACKDDRAFCADAWALCACSKRWSSNLREAATSLSELASLYSPGGCRQARAFVSRMLCTPPEWCSHGSPAYALRRADSFLVQQAAQHRLRNIGFTADLRIKQNHAAL